MRILPRFFTASNLAAPPLQLVWLTVLVAALIISGRSHADNTAPPAPIVEVTAIEPTSIRQWSRFSGRLTAVKSVEIKPLISGTLQEVLFRDGQLVSQGQPLFVIDPRPHLASLKGARAQLATAQSKSRLSDEELQRAQQLMASQLISQSIFDTALSANQVAHAAVLDAESALSKAELNLEYAYIKAPISGRIGRAELTEGNVVDAGINAPVLTSIVANEQLYAEFNVNEQTYLRLIRNVEQQTALPVELSLSDDREAVYHGHLAAFDNRLDSTSGTIRARAIFDNHDGVLTAGMFANIRLGSAHENLALLVPERAVGTNQDKKYVYIIDTDNRVQYREVTLGEQYLGHRIIQAGLEGGEQVVVNGISHIRPKMQVNPVIIESSKHLAAQ